MSNEWHYIILINKYSQTVIYDSIAVDETLTHHVYKGR